jgi:hypothetical protein
MVDEVVTTQAPWEPQQQPLIYGFGEARRLYDQGAPQYYPESTVAPFSQQTQNALTSYEQLAQGPQPVIDAATQQASQTLGGQYLDPSSNPYLQAASDAAGRQVTRQYSEAIAPSIQAQFANSGRTGSGLFANAMDSSRDTLQRGLGEMNSNMYYKNYNDERNRQMQMQGMAGDTAMMQYQPASQLLNVGQTRDMQAQREVEDQFNRYNYNEIQSPYEHLGRYMGNIRGTYGGEGSQSSPIGMEDWLSLGMQGYGLAKEILG